MSDDPEIDRIADENDEPVSSLDDILQKKLENAFHQQTSTVVYHEVAKIASEHSPIDLAYAAPRLPQLARAIIYENLSNLDAKITFMVNTDSSTRLAVFRQINDEEVCALIESMPSDSAVEVLEVISEKRFRKIMDRIDPEKAARIREIKQHARNTAGRLMTNEFFAFTMDVTIGSVSSYIRNNPGIDLTRQIFVVDEDGVLQGYVPSRNLIVNPSQLALKQVMKPVLHKVSVDSAREEVIDLVCRYDISALSVVDEMDKLVGVITYETVIEAIEDISDETIASIAGTAEKVRDNKPLLQRFLSRSPWLVVTLFAGIVNVKVMKVFQQDAGDVLTFAVFFVPLITGMSGNIGIQSSTIMVRGMATGVLTSGSKKDAVYKELTLGFIAAGLFAALTCVLISSLNLTGSDSGGLSAIQGGMIVGVGLFGACLAGSTLGVLSPLFFHRVGVDPAVASGPIVTAVNDFLSMSIFFLIAVFMKTLVF